MSGSADDGDGMSGGEDGMVDTEFLRRMADYGWQVTQIRAARLHAIADRISTLAMKYNDLAAERDRLREALRFYVDAWEHNGIGDPDEPHLYQSWMQPSKDLYEDEGDTARAALSEKEARDD